MPIIGIITRSSFSEEYHETKIIYNNIVKAIIRNKGIPIGIILEENYEDLINLCDGIVFQGGDEHEKFDFKALEYIYKIDKPVLGICLGMQLMGVLFNGKLRDINNHKKKLNYAHSIIVKTNSKLYSIYKSQIIKVNSRHKSALINTNLNVSALSHDGLIEAIEDPKKRFFIGIQWHPEDMIEYDNIQNKVFESFIKSSII